MREFAHLSDLLRIFCLTRHDSTTATWVRRGPFRQEFSASRCHRRQGIQSGTVTAEIPHFERLQTRLEETGAHSKAGVNSLSTQPVTTPLLCKTLREISDLICQEVTMICERIVEKLSRNNKHRIGKKILPSDIYRFLRLFHVNHGLAYSSKLRIRHYSWTVLWRRCGRRS